MVLTETAGTVMTQGERGKQLVVPVVVDLTEVRHQLIAVTGTANGLNTCTGTGPHIVDGLQRIVVTTTCEVDTIVLMSLETEQDVEVVVLHDIEVILDGI